MDGEKKVVKTDGTGFGKKITDSFKDVVPSTTGGKIIASVGVLGLNVGSFFLGRLTKGKGKKKD